jgi:pSer/pThr/pTyr-binding forkhead associated (FHA) protein
MPGLSLRIGRDPSADFAVPTDGLMSRSHLVVETTETICRIRDLKSSNGTFLNGRAIVQAELKHGDEIAAGETHFSVSFTEMAMPIGGDDRVLLNARHPLSVRQILSHDGLQPLFAVLDCAAEPDVLKVLDETKADYQTLLDGTPGVQLVHFAPHLVRLRQGSPILETLIRLAWGKHWGIFIVCGRPPEEIVRHLRHFLTAKLPDGSCRHFRFYDPRILRVFLPTCLPDEAIGFFGPIRYFMVEDESPSSVLVFSSTKSGVARQSIAVATSG